jgi:TolB protein
MRQKSSRQLSRFRLVRAAPLLLWLSVGGCKPAATPAVHRAPEPGERFFSTIEQLTFGGQNAEAYFSPSGDHLIFQRTTSDSTCDQQYIMRLDGSDEHRVSNGLGRTTCGYFYENGARILYSSTFRTDAKCPPPPDYSHGYVWALFNYDIYTSRPDGSDLKLLFASPGYDAESTLSPDGKKIVFTSMRDGDLDIYTMNVDGTDVRRLTNELGYDGGPFFSHDGSMIVYRAWHPNTPEDIADYRALLAKNLVRPLQMDIWVMDSDGSHKRQVTDLGGASFAPYFHPDDRRIIFASNYRSPQSRNFDLFLVNLDGSDLTQVTTDSTFDGFPMFSPDGKRLVFASDRNGSVSGETNIFIADWVEHP